MFLTPILPIILSSTAIALPIQSYKATSSQSDDLPTWFTDVLDSTYFEIFLWGFLVFLPAFSPVICFLWRSSVTGFPTRRISICAYVLLWLYIAYMIPCEVLDLYKYSDAVERMRIAPYILISLLWLFLLLESLGCNEMQYMSNMSDLVSATEFLDKIRGNAPEISFSCECYHWVTRYRTVTYTDSQGRSQTREESHQEMEVTHRDSEVYSYAYHQDVSANNVEGVSSTGVTRISLSKAFSCGDETTRQDFDQKYTNFYERNKNKDLHISHQTHFDIPGYQDRIAVSPDGRVPWWMGGCWFFLATAALLTWPYRLLFRISTNKTHFDIQKQIFLNNK